MSTGHLEIDYERIGERLNSVHALDNSGDPVRRAANRLLYLLAKTYWREDPAELERALSYELTGSSTSEQASRILGGQQAWSEQETSWLCTKYRVQPTFFTQEVAQGTTEQPAKDGDSTRRRAGSNVTKVSVFGGIARKPIQAELDLGTPLDGAKPNLVRVA